MSLDRTVYEAQRAVERRLAAAAGVVAPKDHSEAPAVIEALGLEQATATFAGTGIAALDTLTVIHHALEAFGASQGSLAIFWLGYELGARA